MRQSWARGPTGVPCRIKRLEVRLSRRKHAVLGNPEVAQLSLWRHGSRRTKVRVRDYCAASHDAKQDAWIGDEALAVRRSAVETNATHT